MITLPERQRKGRFILAHGGDSVVQQIVSWQAGSRAKGVQEGVRPSATYFLQLGPISYLLQPHDAITVCIHQGTDPLIRSEPSRANLLWEHPRCALRTQ
jgi:hypothetical protein